MISVVICTHNPRPDLLSWTLASLSGQSLAGSQWELVLVDNRSTILVTLERYLPANFPACARLLREDEPGLSAARCAGIAASRGDLLVFVDDDNQLAPDYLATAAALAVAKPELGAFGGKSHPYFECPPPAWLGSLVNNLGLRDYGNDEIISRESTWGPWEPIGAGMVVRRPVAAAFVRFYSEQRAASQLGRKGDSLASCEDSLIAHLSLTLGFANGYLPQLSLTHFIKDFRTRPSYFARLMQAMGRSYLQLLQLKSGQPAPTPTESEPLLHELADLLPYRLQALGDAGYLQWQWDLGHALPRLALRWPRISVVVPTLNSGATLRRTLESLLAQVYPNLQVIVQDGGSTDDTLAICAEYKNLISLLRSEPDSGQANALNRGFAQADGEILAWLCGDDEYRPSSLFYIALLSLLHPKHDFFVGATLRVFPNGRTAEVRPNAERLHTLGHHNFIDQPSTFWRRNLWKKAGPLDETMRYAFDWEYWNRFIRAGAIPFFAPVQLSVYHFCDTNKTSIAGSRQIPELATVVRRYGPLDGKLARIYQMLYRQFDLHGCYDNPPGATPQRLERFHCLIERLRGRYGAELIHSYNWNYASRQERGLVWYQ